MSWKEPTNFDFSVSMLGMAIAGIEQSLKYLVRDKESGGKICSKRYLKSAIEADEARIDELTKAKEMLERLNIGGRHYRRKMDWKEQDWRNRANLLRSIYFNLLLTIEQKLSEIKAGKEELESIEKLLLEARDWIPPFYS